jgi:chitin synthase
VLALGNRPKGEKGLYILTLWTFAVLALYLVVCSVILSVEAFKVSILIKLKLMEQGALNVDGGLLAKLQSLFNKTNGVLVAAVMSTIGELRCWHTPDIA